MSVVLIALVVLIVVLAAWYLSRPKFRPGDTVTATFVVNNKPDVCVFTSAPLIFVGTVVSVSGSDVTVAWQSMTYGGSDKRCGSWRRDGADLDWQRKYLGADGKAPTYFENVPVVLKDTELTLAL